MLVVVREDEGWRGQQGGADLQRRTLAKSETVDVVLAVCVFALVCVWAGGGGGGKGGVGGVRSWLQLCSCVRCAVRGEGLWD